ncbi:divergent polysaccharide deacetylase family protein [Aurantimonas sp. DM33-3]|nr:divergent polysaccharide deacetylase family protein [Aurantimonas sp. DM33-3]MBC6715731.1 divergent polysaccharide deacetylase family protein [Aurantimonas sp. DM33-3]
MRGPLYQPLGLDLDDGVIRRRRLSAATIGFACAATTIIAGSTAIALFGQPQPRMVDRFDVAASSEPPPTVVAASPAPVVREQLPVVISGSDTAPPPRGGVGFRVEDPQSLRQNPSTAHMPDDALIEDSAYGPLPARAPDGRRPYDVYAGAWSGKPGTRIAIVVGGLGISQTGTMNAIGSLPPGVTFGFSPSGNSLDRWMQEARRSGHELVLQVPMEPVGYPQVDPGEDTLTVGDAAAGDLSALHASLATITNYVGIMNYMGGRFVAEPAAMEPLIAELGRRGLMFFDDASSLRSVAADTAQLQSVPAAVSDLSIDRSQDPADIRSQLDTLERIARAEGTAIGVASAFDVSVATIAKWIGEARGRGIEIVPLSALANDPERR